MNVITPQFAVMILCYISMALAAVVLLVLGIMIVANRTKQTKVLGIGYIITALSSAAVFFYNILLNFFGAEKVVVYGDVVMLGTILCVLGSSLCICIYLHKNYGKKLIYIPVLLMPVVGMIADAGAVLLLNRTIGGGIKHAMLISLVNDVTNILTVTVMSIVIIIVLYRNREKEKIIPKAWLAKCITVIWGIVEIVAVSIIYMSVIAAAEKGDYKSTSDTTLMFLNAVQAVDSLVAVIVPVYVLSSVSKVSRKDKAAACYQEQ